MTKHRQAKFSDRKCLFLLPNHPITSSGYHFLRSLSNVGLRYFNMKHSWTIYVPLRSLLIKHPPKSNKENKYSIKNNNICLVIAALFITDCQGKGYSVCVPEHTCTSSSSSIVVHKLWLGLTKSSVGGK